MPTISMGSIPLEHGLAVAGILFCLGLVGLMVRRNILFVLMAVFVLPLWMVLLVCIPSSLALSFIGANKVAG